MTTGQKIATQRKKNNITQEQLANMLGISRQAVSKWESDMTYPETDKIIRMSELFQCSTDYLLKDEMEEQEQQNQAEEVITLRRFRFRERKSEKSIHGVPLWHVAKNAKGIIALGMNATGVIAIGLNAKGIISLGVLSFGIISFGMLALGLAVFGMFAIGAFSAGAFAVGIMATGAISVGIISVGAISIGDFSMGALARGRYFAMGDNAKAMIAVGKTHAQGSLKQILGEYGSYESAEIKRLLDEQVPGFLGWAANIVKGWL